MGHHKRRRPKKRRAGCILCKPWKANELKNTLGALCPQDRRTKERLDSSVKDWADYRKEGASED